MINLSKTTRTASARDTLAVVDDIVQLRGLDLERNDRQYLTEQLKSGARVAFCDISGRLVMVYLGSNGTGHRRLELARRAGNDMAVRLNGAKRAEAQLVGLGSDAEVVLALAEGVTLGSYAFTKYKTNTKDLPTLKRLQVVAKTVGSKALEELADLCEATLAARDLVNEPLSFLNATQLASEIKTMSRNAGFKVKTLNKEQIEALGMGGLIAVNKGSRDEPTFSVLEWKPKAAVNKKPVVLVGKGVVYDTGGLSLKPTANSMDQMKCDMGGAAAVACAMAAASRQQLPLHIIGLIPATDNRPGGNAYVPGDVVRMHSGLTVEVMNTDAEGRMILADALSYAEHYDPEVVITVATLTGSAANAIGSQGTVVMGTASDQEFQRLTEAGEQVFERVVRFPFWEEYDQEIDSDVADIKNLGGPTGGAITAGKFLARFTSKPFIHMDIAGTAFLTKRDSYRTKGGTGVGVRLIYELLKRRATKH